MCTTVFKMLREEQGNISSNLGSGEKEEEGWKEMRQSKQGGVAQVRTYASKLFKLTMFQDLLCPRCFNLTIPSDCLQQY